MRSATCHAITALLWSDRECYRVGRGIPEPSTLPRPGGSPLPAYTPYCYRCGGVCHPTQPTRHFLTRDRGTTATHVRCHLIHTRCIPPVGTEPQRIRSRPLRAAQVRA